MFKNAVDGGVEGGTDREEVFGSAMKENTVADGRRVSINKNVSANEKQNQNGRKAQIRMEIKVQMEVNGKNLLVTRECYIP